MDRMGGSEGKGRNHGWLLTAGLSTHVDGDPFPEMGEEQVWSVVAAPGLKTPGTKPASAFPVGTAGRRHGESGSEERGHGSGRGRSQGHKIIVTTADTLFIQVWLNSHNMSDLSKFATSHLSTPMSCFIFLHSDFHYQKSHDLLFYCVPPLSVSFSGVSPDTASVQHIVFIG